MARSKRAATRALDRSSKRSARNGRGDRSSNCVLDLPAKIRNRIFYLAMIEPQGALVHIKTRLPDITATCKAVRAETVPIFFGNTRFVAQIWNKDDYELRCWLDAIHDLSLPQPAVVRHLSLLCRGTPLYSFRRDGIPPTVKKVPSFPFWHQLILRLKQAGLTDLQFPKDPSTNTVTLLHDWPDEVLLRQYVLRPLLKHHGLPEPTCIMSGVVDRLRQLVAPEPFTAERMWLQVKVSAQGDPGAWWDD